ncbi:MAG: DctP family TRAP transporter solute-binding subunit [Chloroflexi bacterium]|nr:DctP family TRAP transporter solute-binding subunit [Chloroflexota bacterium]
MSDAVIMTKQKKNLSKPETRAPIKQSGIAPSKKLRSLLAISVALALGLLACNHTTTMSTAPVVVRLTHVGNPQTNFGRAAIRFAELTTAKTNGQVRMEVFPELSLSGGDNLAALKKLQEGEVDATLHSNLIYANLDPRFEVFSLPYVMTSRQAAYRVVDGDVGNELLCLMKQYNIIGLAYGENGFRQVTNSKRPVARPDDIQGLRIRVPETKLYLDTMKALGADAQVMTFNQVYAALQRGELDGQENPLSIIYSSELYKVQKYLTVWDYSWDTVVLGFNRGFWDRLPQYLKDALRLAAQETMISMRQWAQNDDQSLLEQLRKAGMEVTVLTAAQKQPFIEATKPVYAAEEAKVGKELVARVQKIGRGD